MKPFLAAAACAASFLALPLHASGLGDPEMNAPQRLVQASLREEVAADDPRVAKAREMLVKAGAATGETDLALAQACMRNARYIFDASRRRANVSALEVLEAVAAHAPAGKPLAETTQRYVDLRVKQKLDHAGALAQMAAGK